MNFGSALQILKSGGRVAREGWNGKSMWLRLVRPLQPPATRAPGFPFYTAHVVESASDPELELLPWIGMKTADNKFVPWLASQTDLLAEDWEIV